MAAAIVCVSVLSIPLVATAARVRAAATTRSTQAALLNARKLALPASLIAAPASALGGISGTMSVNNGASFTATTGVTLNSAVSGATRIRVDDKPPWKAVAIGRASIGVRTDGTLWTWGEGANGKLGTGSLTDSLVPVQVGTASTWTTVAASYYDGFAIRSDGTLWGWGQNAWGELGTGAVGQQSTPVQIAAGETWRAIAPSDRFALAIRTDGTLWAWGTGTDGQLGNGGNPTQQLTRTQVAPGTTWKSVAAGTDHVVAVRSDGTLWAWGGNGKGQLGRGNTTPSNVPVQIGALTTWVSATAGAYDTLVLRSDNTVWGCGYGLIGQLGSNNPVDSSSLVQASGGAVYRTLATGAYSSAAIRTDGSLVCWGANWSGQLGDNSTTQRNVPTPVYGGGTDWTTIYVSTQGTAGIRGMQDLGDLYVWGGNGQGEVGDKTTTQRNVPTPVWPGGTWQTYVSAFPYSLTPPAPDGVRTVTAWYRDDLGNYTSASDSILLGNAEFAINGGASFANSMTVSLDSTTAAAQDMKANPPFKQVVTSQSHSAGIASDGTLWTWGGNSRGQLGVGSMGGSSLVPVKVGTDTWRSIAVGANFTVGVKTDGTLWGWGDNGWWQLGTSAVASSTVPLRIGAASNWTTVTAGYTHAAALDSTGKAWAWGCNTYNQVASGLGNAQSSPWQTGAGYSFKQIEAGADYTMGLTPNGDVYVWGQSSSTVNKVTGLPLPARYVAGEYYSMLAIVDDGRMYTWGANGMAQLGVGDYSNRTTPTEIGAGTQWATASLADYHGLAVSVNGELWGWGSNNVGNVGDGTTNVALTPVRIGSSTSWTSVAVSDWHSLALQGDALWAWGENGTTGFLGNLGTIAPAVPTLAGTAWQPYASRVPFTIPATTDMTATVPMFYRTSAGYLYWAADSIYLDSMPPAGSIAINGGASVTTTTTVTFTSNVTGATKMRIGGAAWQAAPPVGASVSTTLTPGDGTKTVSADFADDAGNTITVTDTIELDTTPPSGTMSLNGGAPFTRSTRVEVDSEMTDTVLMQVPAGGWTQAAAGYAAMLGLRSDGSLWSWGRGDYGQLGTGSALQLSPERVGAETDWTTITAGDWHMAALKSDGSLWTWGLGTYGAIGNGGSADKWAPTRIMPGTTFTSVSAGSGHSLALQTDGTLWAWGANSYGQVGNGSTSHAYAPVRIGGTTKFKWVSGGGRMSYAIKTDGTLMAWGDNSAGEIGDGTTTQRTTPTTVSAGPWSAVWAGDTHAAAMKPDGSLWVWGEVGDGVNPKVPTQVAGSWLWAAPGMKYTVARKLDGTVWSWGSNNGYGQMGNGSTATTGTPTMIPAFGWTSGDSNMFYASAIDAAGNLMVWGYNGNNTYGSGTSTPSSYSPFLSDWRSYATTYAVTVPAGAGVKSVTALYKDANGNVTSVSDTITLDASGALTLNGGSASTSSTAIEYGSNVPGVTTMMLAQPVAAIEVAAGEWAGQNSDACTVLQLRDGPLLTFGKNDSGQRGDGSVVAYGSNSAIATMSADHDWKRVSAGRWHTLAVKNDGSLWAWGNNQWGELGDGTTANSTVPKRIGTSQWVDVCAFATMSGGVKRDGTLWRWGEDSSSTPVQVGTENDWAKVAVGTHSYLALKTDGRLYAWSSNGYTYYGEMGLNWDAPTSPTLVSTGWASISTGDYFTLGLKNDGTLWGMGLNDEYQLGDGTLTTRRVPTLIDAGRWRSVSAGWNHAVAVAADGSVWAWGDNSRGQLADGTSTDRSRPNRVGTRTDWVLADAGGYCTVGTTADGTVWGWGSNFAGALGSAAAATNTSPIVIRAAAWEPYAATAIRTVPWVSHDTTLWAGYQDAWGNVDWFSDSISFDSWAPTTTVTAPAGWSKDTVDVGLSPADGDSGVAETFYRIGSGSWLPFTGATFPVSAEGTTVVSFYSVDAAGNREATKSANVRIDRTPPVTTSDAVPGGWQRQFVLGASDAMSGVGLTYYRIDGGLQQLYTGPTLMAEGVHTVQFWSEDVVGNAETPTSAVYRCDLTKPTSSASGVPAGWTNADVDVTLSGDDALSGLAGVCYTLDGSAPATYAAMPVHVSAEGTHTIRYWSVDVSGLVEDARTATVRIDKTLPSTVADYDGAWRPGPVRVTLTSADPTSGSGTVAETTYRAGTEATATYSGPIDISAEGTTTIVYTSRDAAGNQEPANVLLVRIDTVDPATRVSAPPAEGGGAVCVSLESSDDDGSGVASTWFRIGGGPARPYTASTRAIVVTETGDTTVSYWSVDKVGNVETTREVVVSRSGTGSTGHGGNIACLTCHDAVRGIVPARVDYAVPDVDLNACGTCHWIGVHPGHAADSDCVACHPTFPSRQVYYSPKVATAYGNFTSAGSISLSPASIHQIHAAGSWPQTATANPSVCASCHRAASCDACHTGVTHREHAHAPQPATYPAVTYQAASGTPVGDTTIDYSAQYTSTCSSTRCHDMNAARTTVARTVYEESGPAVTRTGTWASTVKASASGGFVLSSATAGSSLTYTFSGPGEIRLFGMRHSRGGIVSISLDGAAPVEVSTYSALTTYRDLLFASSAATGTHTVRATVTGRFIAPSTSAQILLDAAHVVLSTPSATDFVPGCDGCHTDKVGTHGYAAMDHVADETDTVAPGLGGTACGVCHRMELMDEHAKATSSSTGRSCANCHPSPRKSFGGWAQTCEQGGCHATGGPEERHLRLPTVHRVSQGGKSSCSRNCHDGDLVAEHTRQGVSCAACHTSPKFAAVFDTPSGWNGTCQACHATGLKHGTSAGNAWCTSCHGASDTTMTAVAGASAYGASAGDHETGYAGSAHSEANVAAGTIGGVDSDSQCEACHNHASVRAGSGAPTDYRADGGPASQDLREALCFRCHSASGDETRSPGARPYTWNGRDVAAEFARRSAHPVTVGTPESASAQETVTAFVQSTAAELDSDSKFQLGSVSTSGAVLAWDTYTVDGSARKLLYFIQNRYYENRVFSQFDPGQPFSSGWNSSGYDPADIGSVMPQGIERGTSAAVVDNTLVWSGGTGTTVRYRYTPPARSSDGPGAWSGVSALPFTASGNVDTAEDPDHGYVYYIGGTGQGSGVYKWRYADDTWTAPIDARLGVSALNISTNSGITYSPETGRLYLAIKNPSALGKVYWTGTPSAASGQTQFTDTGLALNDTYGIYSGYAYTDLQCFSRGGHDYLFYTGSFSYDAKNQVRMSVIGGLADGTHAARTIPDWTWTANGGADVCLAWDGGDYMYMEVANQSVGRIRIPEDPMNDAWEPWEQLPDAPRASVYDDDPGVIAMLDVVMPAQAVTGYRQLGTLSAEFTAPDGVTAWDRLTIEKREPAMTMVRVRVEGWNGSGWETVPGMASVAASSLDLSSIDPGAFPRLRLTATLTTSDTNASPRLTAWRVTATREAPIPQGTSLTCVSCHNTHLVAKGGAGAWDVARVSDPRNTKNAAPASMTDFCLTCHSATIPPVEKAADGLVPYAIAFRGTPAQSLFPGWLKDAGALGFKNSGHFKTAGTKALCESCHDPHGSDNARLTAWTRPSSWTTGAPGVRDNRVSAAGEQALCLQCHGNGVFGKQAPGAPDAAGAVAGTYAHNPAAGGRHTDTETVAGLGAGNRHAECVDCHDPHVAQPGTHMQGLSTAGPAIRGAWGVKPTWSATMMSSPTSLDPLRLTAALDDNEAYLCFKCHTGAQPAVATRSNGTTYAPTDIAAEFNPANASYHNVLGLPGGPKTSWTFNGTTIVWPFPAGVFQPGWDAYSKVTCTDCHTSGTTGAARGPHGSSAKWMMDPAYPVDWENGRLDFGQPNGMTPGIICNKCHRIFDGDNGVHGADGIATQNIHSVYSHSCTGCHIRIPHGWKRPKLLVYDSDPAPYGPNQAINGHAVINSVSIRTHNDRFSNPNWISGDCGTASGCSGYGHSPNAVSGPLMP